MAGIVTQEHDLPNGRVCSMWAEAGIQFRSNLLLHAGATCPLHAHSYDHVADIRHGQFGVVEVRADGERRDYEAVAPCRITIPAGHQHSFTLKTYDGKPGEICCMWGD